MIRCQRCGADNKECPITKSHAPQTAIIKMCGKRGWRRGMKIFRLCTACHDRYSELEKKILREACDRMRQAHEEYINQPEIV